MFNHRLSDILLCTTYKTVCFSLVDIRVVVTFPIILHVCTFNYTCTIQSDHTVYKCSLHMLDFLLVLDLVFSIFIDMMIFFH